jgi:hypothetical protein
MDAGVYFLQARAAHCGRESSSGGSHRIDEAVTKLLSSAESGLWISHSPLPTPEGVGFQLSPRCGWSIVCTTTLAPARVS